MSVYACLNLDVMYTIDIAANSRKNSASAFVRAEAVVPPWRTKSLLLA